MQRTREMWEEAGGQGPVLRRCPEILRDSTPYPQFKPNAGPQSISYKFEFKDGRTFF